MVDTDGAWEKIARSNPFWGVLSSDEFLGADLDGDAKERFFRSGEQHIDHVLDVLRIRIAPDFRPVSALDYGCGVGRLLLPLARTCDRVVGVDVSVTMIKRASEHVSAAGLTNVELRHVDDLHSTPRPVDLVHSALVLQHVTPARGMAILDSLVDLLEVGGCGAIQLHLRGAGNALVRSSRRLRNQSQLAYGLYMKALRRPPRDALILMHSYDSAAVLWGLADRGAPAVFIETEAGPGGDTDVMVYFQKQQ